MREIYRTNESEYKKKSRDFKTQGPKDQKKKFNTKIHIPQTKRKKVPLQNQNVEERTKKRRHMKKYFLVKRLKPGDKKENQNFNCSDDIYFN